jgi:hypothetical protein
MPVFTITWAEEGKNRNSRKMKGMILLYIWVKGLKNKVKKNTSF